MTYIRITNWEHLQHYKDRDPPWIKLHNRWLAELHFRALPDASKLLLILLWLLRSRLEGDIPLDGRYIKEMTGFNGKVDLKSLLDNNFVTCYQDASVPQATCAPEESRGEQRRAETEDSGFDEFWKAYPRREAKADAKKAFQKLAPNDLLLHIIHGALATQSKSEQWRKDGGKYIPLPASWLNGKRWEDEPISVSTDRKCSCGRPADGVSKDDSGQEYGWCRTCQPRKWARQEGQL